MLGDCDFECQCGNGLAGFEGVRYQKGFGLLSSLFSKALPYLKKFGSYIGKNLLNLGSGVASDIVEGKPIKESAKKRLKQTASTVVSDGMTKIQSLLQEGKGRERRQIGLGKKRTKNRIVNKKKKLGLKKKTCPKNKKKKSCPKKKKRKTCRKVKRRNNKSKAGTEPQSFSFLA